MRQPRTCAATGISGSARAICGGTPYVKAEILGKSKKNGQKAGPKPFGFDSALLLAISV